MNNVSDNRDRLALTRTQLANERTLLAYIRTGLSLLAVAALLLHFSPSFKESITLAWCSGIVGIVILVVGFIRFFLVKKLLRENDRFK